MQRFHGVISDTGKLWKTFIHFRKQFDLSLITCCSPSNRGHTIAFAMSETHSWGGSGRVGIHSLTLFSIVCSLNIISFGFILDFWRSHMMFYISVNVKTPNHLVEILLLKYVWENFLKSLLSSTISGFNQTLKCNEVNEIISIFCTLQ